MTRRMLVVISISVAIILVFVFFSSHGLLTRWRLSSTREMLIEQRGSLLGTEDSLRSVIKSLESDTTIIERLARERYGYVRPGEQVFIIGNSHTAAGTVKAQE
ncbi:MAG: hypothetical protein AMXMBFR68_12810 [Ignavibacteria bacterium]